MSEDGRCEQVARMETAHPVVVEKNCGYEFSKFSKRTGEEHHACAPDTL